MINKAIVLLDNTSTSTVSVPISIEESNLMTLEVSSTTDPVGAVSIVIYGRTDINSEQWTTMAAINLSSLKIVQTISTVGNYFLPVTGVTQIYVASQTVAGDTRVYAKLAS